jgi:hypothetical protein
VVSQRYIGPFRVRLNGGRPRVLSFPFAARKLASGSRRTGHPPVDDTPRQGYIARLPLLRRDLLARSACCPGGGIGRRAGFRYLWPQGRESSSLFLGTNTIGFFAALRHLLLREGKRGANWCLRLRHAAPGPREACRCAASAARGPVRLIVSGQAFFRNRPMGVTPSQPLVGDPWQSCEKGRLF